MGVIFGSFLSGISRVAMERTLLLNATFEPLKIISWQRAITLLTQGKVEVIDFYDRDVAECPSPSNFLHPQAAQARQGPARQPKCSSPGQTSTSATNTPVSTAASNIRPRT
jgi:hypothetical protein